MTAPITPTNVWAEMIGDVALYQSPDVDAMTLCAIAVTEELRIRLLMRFGADRLDVCRIVAEVLDGYAREQIAENSECDCDCEDYDCEGACCGTGRCTCTPGFELAVQLAAEMPVTER